MHRRLLVLVALLGCGCSAPEDLGSSSEAYTTQCPDAAVVEGVDISSSQSPVVWTSVLASGRHFAFIKATQGDYYTSTNFASQYAGAKAASVYRSAYHFFDPTIDGIAQANYFLGVVGTLAPDDLPPMLDVECPDGSSTCLGFTGGSGNAPAATIVQRALDWLSTVEAKTGKKPIVYTFPSYFPGLATSDSALAAYPLFIATLASCAAVPAPWTSAVFWQYSWTGTVNGIPGQVDLDRFFGTLSDLQLFAAPTTGDGGTVNDGGNDAAADAAAADAHDASPAFDASDEAPSPPSGGCACDAAGAPARDLSWLWAVVLVVARRGRRPSTRIQRRWIPAFSSNHSPTSAS